MESSLAKLCGSLDQISRVREARLVLVSRCNPHAIDSCGVVSGIDRLEMPEVRLPAKVREEYRAICQTKFAPMTLKTNATFMMLKSAKTTNA